jgi:hypothetical protein
MLFMSNIGEPIDVCVERVKEQSEHVMGTEQATKRSLIRPFLTMPGHDVTDHIAYQRRAVAWDCADVLSCGSGRPVPLSAQLMPE